MKLYFAGHDYKYAAEQIMLMMFPAERPEYPEDKFCGGENTVYISLSRAEKYITAYVRVTRGKTAEGTARVQLSRCTDELMSARLEQRVIKLAFYRAAVRLGIKTPVWGAMTGIRPGKTATGYMLSGLSADAAAKKMQREYDVSPERSRLAVRTARASLDLQHSLGPRDIALYVGIPFCPTRCAYCSFVSNSTEKSIKLIEPFLAALNEELDAAGAAIEESGLRVISVYFGGGTPTTLTAPQLDALISRLYERIDLSAMSEFTVEAGRPDTITPEKMRILKKHGVTRVSINPQTMSDEILRIIGRKHTSADILTAYDIARSAGLEQVNMDLIAGLPGDDAIGFSKTLDAVLELNPENVTVHTLSLKNGTRITLEETPLPPPAEVGAMLDYAERRLTGAEYEPYYLYRQKFISGGFENVGWAKKGCHSSYNILIMEELRSVIALGGGGSTKLVVPEKGKIERIFNAKYPYEYIERISQIAENKKKVTEFYLREGVGL